MTEFQDWTNEGLADMVEAGLFNLEYISIVILIPSSTMMQEHLVIARC